MDPRSFVTFTPYDVRFGRWLATQTDWTKEERAQVVRAYLQVRALEHHADEDEDVDASRRVIDAYVGRERQYQAGTITAEAFRRDRVAFEAGWQGNSVAILVTLIVARAGNLDFDRITADSGPPERPARPMPYEFSSN